MPELSFQVTRTEEGVVALSGVIDENADLSFFERFAGHTRVSLRHVRRINSYGVRSWIENVRKVPREATFEILECPPSVVDQINMVAGFMGRGHVTSFYAPMECERCHHQEDRLFFTADYRRDGRLPPAHCSQCDGRLHVDDLEDQYLLFARELGR